MGRNDIITKDYVKDSRIFADVFNNAVYKGRQIITPERLKAVDSTVIGVPYGTEEADLPVQKYRDVFKCLAAMEDERMVYLLLGLEPQKNVHFAMPVRAMVYDALGYAEQVEKAANTHREERKKTKEKGEKNETLTSGEYLSGFYRTDRLIPILTLVLYLGADPWNGPLGLHEMLSVREPGLLEFIPDYRINLVSPAQMSEEEINRFRTSLREVMLFIKYSKDKRKLGEVLQRNGRYQRLERKAAKVIGAATNVNVDLESGEEGEVNVCQAWIDMGEECREEGRKEASLSAARRMLSKGRYSREDISEITGIPAEKIAELCAE